MLRGSGSDSKRPCWRVAPPILEPFEGLDGELVVERPTWLIEAVPTISIAVGNIP